MVNPVSFDPQGQELWINIEMTGIYFITYTYQLWSAEANTPPVLTLPVKSGSNEIPHDDFYPVMNDYNPSEPVIKNTDRIVDVRFWVKKGDDDNGYNLRVTVYQGDSFPTANIIGFHEVGGNNGSASLKEEFITIKLVN